LFNNVQAIQVGDASDADLVLTDNIDFFGASSQITLLQLASNTKTIYVFPNWAFEVRIGNQLEFINSAGTIVGTISL
jgi:hypothetical protein